MFSPGLLYKAPSPYHSFFPLSLSLKIKSARRQRERAHSAGNRTEIELWDTHYGKCVPLKPQQYHHRRNLKKKKRNRRSAVVALRKPWKKQPVSILLIKHRRNASAESAHRRFKRRKGPSLTIETIFIWFSNSICVSRRRPWTRK